MGKSQPAPPPIPNPNELINAQADANRISQFTPYGNLRFGSVGDQGQFVEGAVPDDGRAAAFTQETPFQTQMRAAQEGTGLGLSNLAFNRIGGQTVVGLNPDGSPIYAANPNFSNPFNTAPTLAGVSQAQDIDPTTGLPAFQSSVNTGQAIPQNINTAGLTALTNDPVGLRSNIEQTLFNRQLGLLQPEFTRQTQDLQQNLADRGIPITSQAYNDATNRLQAQQGEQMQRLAQQATLAAGQESDRIVDQSRNIRAQQFGERAAAGEFGLASQGQGFGQAAANAQLANAARQDTVANQLLSNQIANQQRSRQIAERNALRGQNFNELAALLGGPQINQPSFFAPGAIDTQGAFGAAQAAQQNAFNQAQASRSADLGGLFGLAGNLGAAYLLR
tara:strand:- start:189 stop:1361 length:1173 start_codon:yes stop_codon:yes gene_type:complete